MPSLRQSVATRMRRSLAGQLGDLLFAFVVADVAGDRLDVHAREFPREELAELVRDIVSGGNEAAEDDRTAVHV